MLHRAIAARLDGRLKDGIKLLARDHEWPAPRVVARGERALSRKALLQRIEKLLKVRRWVRRGDRIVECLRLFVERKLLALEDTDPRVERGELTVEVLMAQAAQLVSTRGQLKEVGAHRAALRDDLIQADLGGVGVALPLRRAVVGVDVVLVVLTEGKDGLDIALREGIHRGRIRLSHLRLPAAQSRRRKQDPGAGCNYRAFHELVLLASAAINSSSKSFLPLRPPRTLGDPGFLGALGVLSGEKLSIV